MSKAKAVLAVETNLAHHDGAANMKWSGVTFAHGTWLRPMEGMGYVENQGGACATCLPGGSRASCGLHDNFTLSPGSVVVSRSRNIEFSGCVFRQLGAFGAQAVGGSQGVAWRSCNFSPGI